MTGTVDGESSTVPTANKANFDGDVTVDTAVGSLQSLAVEPEIANNRTLVSALQDAPAAPLQRGGSRRSSCDF